MIQTRFDKAATHQMLMLEGNKLRNRRTIP